MFLLFLAGLKGLLEVEGHLLSLRASLEISFKFRFVFARIFVCLIRKSGLLTRFLSFAFSTENLGNFFTITFLELVVKFELLLLSLDLGFEPLYLILLKFYENYFFGEGVFILFILKAPMLGSKLMLYKLTRFCLLILGLTIVYIL